MQARKNEDFLSHLYPKIYCIATHSRKLSKNYIKHINANCQSIPHFKSCRVKGNKFL